jgi:hypothetical protein
MSEMLAADQKTFEEIFDARCSANPHVQLLVSKNVPICREITESVTTEIKNYTFSSDKNCKSVPIITCKKWSGTLYITKNDTRIDIYLFWRATNSMRENGFEENEYRYVSDTRVKELTMTDLELQEAKRCKNKDHSKCYPDTDYVSEFCWKCHKDTYYCLVHRKKCHGCCEILQKEICKDCNKPS